MSIYCTTADVYRWIPPGSVSNPARLVASVATSGNVLTIEGHGLALNTVVTFRAEGGGTLPSPIVDGTTYYAIPLTDSTFQVSTASGGGAVDITTTGSNTVMVQALPWATWIEEASAEIDNTLPDFTVALSPVPAIVRSYASALVAERALTFCGVSSDALRERMISLRLELKEWRKGVPLRGTSKAIGSGSSALVGSSTAAADPRGWDHPSGRDYLP